MAYPTTPAPNTIDEVNRRYIVETVEAEDGTTYTYLRKDKLLLTWRLTYTLLTEAHQVLLDAWYVSVKGNYSTDTFTHPESLTSHTVRCTSMKRVDPVIRGGYGNRRRSYEVVLEEQP